MDKNILINEIEKGLSQRQIAESLNCSQSTIKHWLKKFGLKTLTTSEFRNLDLPKDMKKCNSCGEIKNKKDFYFNSGTRDKLMSCCSICSNKKRVNRGRANKIKIIEYKGNKCEHCDLHINDSHYSVFDLHHNDPTKKDPKFSSFKYWAWDKIVNEIDKCSLLCSNCHRIEHAKLGDW